MIKLRRTMRLLDKFFNKPATEAAKYEPATEQEAWAGILYACMVANDDVDCAEVEHLMDKLILEEKFAGVNFVGLYKAVADQEMEIGGYGLVKACSKHVEKKDREKVFSKALEIVLADGTIDDDERKIIDAIAKEMHITKKTVNEMINNFVPDAKE